jgi:hypothetical protein
MAGGRDFIRREARLAPRDLQVADLAPIARWTSSGRLSTPHGPWSFVSETLRERPRHAPG